MEGTVKAAVISPHPQRPLALSSVRAALRGMRRQTNPILIEEEETMVSLFGVSREGLTGLGKMQIGRSLGLGQTGGKEQSDPYPLWVEGCRGGLLPSLIKFSHFCFTLTHFLTKKVIGKGKKNERKKEKNKPPSPCQAHFHSECRPPFFFPGSS